MGHVSIALSSFWGEALLISPWKDLGMPQGFPDASPHLCSSKCELCHYPLQHLKTLQVSVPHPQEGVENPAVPPVPVVQSVGSPPRGNREQIKSVVAAEYEVLAFNKSPLELDTWLCFISGEPKGTCWVVCYLFNHVSPHKSWTELFITHPVFITEVSSSSWETKFLSWFLLFLPTLAWRSC